MEFPKTERNTVRRAPKRGHYDQATINEILDIGFLCHVGFVVDRQPFVIPTCYGRDGDHLYMHGAATSRMIRDLAVGIPACVTVTHLDGLVLARSAFHHSVNYRSVVVFGTAREVGDDEKDHGLRVISEHILKGRWEEARRPNERERKATSVISLTIESASAKIRTGPPHDEEEDYALPIWAGLVPLHQHAGPAEPDPRRQQDVPLPTSVAKLLAKTNPR